jgi:hypothetical protein
MIAIAEVEARCLRHPDRTAHTCSRCGGYCCDACRRSRRFVGWVCLECIEGHYQKLRAPHARAERFLRQWGTWISVMGALIAGWILWLGIAGGPELGAQAVLMVGPLPLAAGIGGPGLRKLKVWARPAVLIPTLITMAIVPFGLPLALYALWLLHGPSGRAIFSRDYQEGLHLAGPEIEPRPELRQLLLSPTAVLVATLVTLVTLATAAVR